MSLMLTGVSLAHTAPAKTVVGYLHCYTAGATVPSNYLLTAPAAGLFAIEATPNGQALVSAATPLPIGFYSIKIRALGTAAPSIEIGHFQIEVHA